MTKTDMETINYIEKIVEKEGEVCVANRLSPSYKIINEDIEIYPIVLELTLTLKNIILRKNEEELYLIPVETTEAYEEYESYSVSIHKFMTMEEVMEWAKRFKVN